MRPLPLQYQRYTTQVQALLERGALRVVEFSGGTYQVQVIDPDFQEPLWAFLQIDDKQRICDAFCSCESAENTEACVHLAAAFQRIFLKSDIPLHERFHDSLWNKLCLFLCEILGDDAQTLILHDEEHQYRAMHEDRMLFSIEPLSQEIATDLEDRLQNRPLETEETSLKFSNLSEEELRLWKQGRPSSQLRYELSFWNDLAKWMMFLQEDEKLRKVWFTYFPSQIPQRLFAEFEGLRLEVLLNADLLTQIIPSLEGLPFPLKIYGKPEEQIGQIVYDDVERQLIVSPIKPSAETERERAIGSFGEWEYFPEKGFFFRGMHPLLKRHRIPQNEMGQILHSYFPLLRKKLKGVQIHEESLSVSYALHFDEEWNLHIIGYLKQPGDLQADSLQFFDDWFYSPSQGFFHLENAFFSSTHQIIPQEHVSEFIQTHRIWINQQEGFQMHLTGIETKWIYTLLNDHSLLFSRDPVIEESDSPSKDFGTWLYIKDQGFFSKATTDLGIALKEGLRIPQNQVSLFIRTHREELSLILNFFCSKSPLERIGLHIECLGGDLVQIRPEICFLAEYDPSTLLFFDEFIYIPQQGFYQIPEHKLPPEHFRHPIQLHRQQFPFFFAKKSDLLAKHLLSIDPSLTPLDCISPTVDKVEKMEAGFRIKLLYVSEKARIKATELWKSFKEQDRFFFSDQGYLDLHDDRFSWMRRIPKKHIDMRSNWLTLSPVELLKLNAFDPLAFTDQQQDVVEFLALHAPEEPNLSALKSVLRSYQHAGVLWIWFLYMHGLSGLLCDDMGLGKTHQAMGLMAAILNTCPRRPLFLVICPTSVIFHWQEKLEEYLPKADVCVYHGSKRSLKEFKEKGNVLLTSYGIWRNESALLSEIPFDVAFLDEIHTAKNETSRIHHTLLQIKARTRIGLTGTPIENRLRELKALFDIVIPRYMPSENEYRQFFALPIEKGNNRERRALLSRFIKPFVLRRKKTDVLLDLPAKIEEVSHCMLSRDQHLLYNQLLQTTGQMVCNELKNHTIPMPYIHIFSLLSSLKQICDHPAVYLKMPGSYKQYASGKWDLFVELLSEALKSEQKVVIFSQYLAMLDIIEHYLEEKKISYATIRGATTNRAEQIHKFNQDPSCKVFVGSLHAAGFGIDLTAGSVVIHYDRWWNAAREDQATDRVHRIGQTRGVQVFKLVTKKTFEERIDEMILRKRKLMEDIVSIDDYRFLKQFDREELLQLFQQTTAEQFE